DLGQRLDIQHFGFRKLFSKWQGKKSIEDGARVLSKMRDHSVAVFDGQPFLFTLNNDVDDKGLEAVGGTRIPAVAHGLNDYQSYMNVFFGAALNREPKHNRMLQDLGFSPKCIQQASMEVVYQGTMRSALRDFTSRAIVRVIVPDLPTARYLHRHIGSRT